MELGIIINQDRSVIINANKQGNVKENGVTSIKLTYPEELKEYSKTIEFETDDGTVFDVIFEDKYVFKNNITKYEGVIAQIVFEDSENNKRWKSDIFELYFGKSINAEHNIDDEETEHTVIDTIIDEINSTKRNLLNNYYNKTTMNGLLNGKVDKETGKGLSENDFSNDYKNKVDSIEENADVNLIESISVNNATQQIDQNKNVNITVPTKTSDLENDDNVVKDPNYQHITIDDDLDGNSTNPLQNKKIVSELNKKLNSSIANVFFKDIEYNASTGIFTFIKYDNTQITVDLPIETTVKSGRYDATTHKLILVLMSDDTVEIPVSDLVDVYTGDTNTQIQVVVKSGNIIEAILRKGSITEEYLDSDLVEKVNDNRNIAFATFDIDLETGSLIMYTNKQMDLEFRLSQETGNMEVLI
ncbi:MAG: hypothetical protein IKM97_05095 [Clostridia bacterium]|nr:hypothetical protein [Clostridia bacterium]